MTDPNQNPASPAGVDEIGDSWKTQELRDAEAVLDEHTLAADELIEKADQVPLPPPDNPASDEKLAAIKAAAEAHDAPPEMRVLKRKVDEGVLTWADVLSGKAYTDPDVQAAMAAKMEQMREIYAEFEAGHTLDEVLEAHGVDPNDVPPPPAPAAAGSAGQDDVDDDEWDEDDRLQRGTPPPPEPEQPSQQEQADPQAGQYYEDDDDEWDDDDRFQRGGP